MNENTFLRIVNQRRVSLKDVEWLCNEICKFQSENDRLKLRVANAGSLLYKAIRELSVIAPAKNPVEKS